MNLRLSCLHFRVEYKKKEKNQERLLDQIREEASSGAHMILTPEMAVSGYSFASREDILPYTVAEDDSFVAELSAVADHHSCYICLGAATRVQPENIVYNSALFIGPDKLLRRYDKVNGEIRWSCPGRAVQDNVVQTPWGKVGVLICSDSYFELMARSCALKDADLLLIPANWPDVGIDPVEVWRVRALENGIYVAGCNRTGQDLQMDCRSAQSACISPHGEILACHQSAESSILRVRLPLEKGKLMTSDRVRRLGDRRPEWYHNIYRSLAAIQDLTSFYDLPESGLMEICCLVPGTEIAIDEMAHNVLEKVAENAPRLWILPPVDSANHSWVGVWDDCLAHNSTDQQWLLYRDLQKQSWRLVSSRGNIQEGQTAKDDGPPWITFDVGPVRVALTDYDALRHPECVLSLSKEGCDLVVLIENALSDEMKLLCGARTINHVAIAACSGDGAGIWMPPEGHARWQETLVQGQGSCTFTLDSTRTRNKRFQDRVDFKTLLSPLE